MNKFVAKYMQMSRQYISDSGNLAEEVISTIRTAQAFGTQKALAALYDTHINKAKSIDSKAAIWQGGSFGAFFFILYSGYALAFSFGTTLINEGRGE
jgi:ATP-binding cassette subfamily B (MDR/TAP) protein 1